MREEEKDLVELGEELGGELGGREVQGLLLTFNLDLSEALLGGVDFEGPAWGGRGEEEE